MENLLQGLKHVVVHFDGILLTGSDRKNHLNNVTKFLRRMEDRGIKIKFGNCQFMMDVFENLGNIIGVEGLHSSLIKVAAVLKAPALRHIKEVQSFLSLVNYYREFIENISSNAPLASAAVRQSDRVLEC